MLERLERKIDALARDLTAIRAHLTAAPSQVHEPMPGLPVFDEPGREIAYSGGADWDLYPLTATCRCGRQIVQASPVSQWQH
jgi:hypothetical protein